MKMPMILLGGAVAAMLLAAAIEVAERLPAPLSAPQPRTHESDKRIISRYGLTNNWPLNLPASGCTNKESLMP